MNPPVRRAALALLFATTSCSTGSTASTPTVQVADVGKTSVLQFAVGTATIAISGGTFIGTNMVSTLRGPNGHSAILSNTPTITGPPNFAIGFPGSPNSLAGILPNVLSQDIMATDSGAPFPASFGSGLGPLVGVFGYGMAADNLLSSQVALQLNSLISATKVPCPDVVTSGGNAQVSTTFTSDNGAQLPGTSEAQSNELALPLGTGAPQFVPNAFCPVSPITSAIPYTPGIGQTPPLPINYYGGPPAWPSAQGYGNPTFFIGYPLGFTDVAAAPVAGKYTLDVAYATNTNSTAYGHFDATASLHSVTPLPPLSITSATINANGSGSVTMTVPPGLYETIVFIRAIDCNNQSNPDDNYAIVTHSAGPQNFFFASNLGPPNAAGQPAATFCAGPNGGYIATAYAAGFDYPAYESSYPFNVSQTPAITNGDGHTGQADVTTSLPLPFTPVQ